MKRFTPIAVATMLAIGASFLFNAGVGLTADESKLLEFNSMIGVPRPYTGSSNAVRNVPGGGLPWVIAFGKGKVSPQGDVDVLVRGLVFDPSDQAVIDRGIGGTNTVPNFKAVVSCLSKDAAGGAIIVNVPTGPFPADVDGNAHIRELVALPSPCIAPILFVTSPTGSWFASTGF